MGLFHTNAGTLLSAPATLRGYLGHLPPLLCRYARGLRPPRSVLMAVGATLLTIIAAIPAQAGQPSMRDLPSLFTTVQHASAPVQDPSQASSSCPSANALKNFRTDANVSASFSNSGNTTTYRFVSLVNENPAGGVPGLIRYCVYPTPAAAPASANALAAGANGAHWKVALGRSSFSFSRPTGNPSNIPLNGQSTVVGTATWSTVPTAQAILLHINDPAVCATLYGAGSDTCFVKAAGAPVCNQGATNVAYNAMPFGVVDCQDPSVGFEAVSASEFGDEVQLASGPTGLRSLSVLFASFGCQAGHWNTGDCSTTAGATFTHPITANIYAVATCGSTPCPGALLGTVTATQTIPYRPSADPVNCTGADAGKWYNPAAGVCQNQISTVLTFSFSAAALPSQVIWTVAFNTTHYGYAPIGQGAACYGSAGGCPYDSLNVGAKSHTNAPYAGTDVDPNGVFFNSSFGGSYCDGGAGGTGTLRLDTSCWGGFRPLGQITTQ